MKSFNETYANYYDMLYSDKDYGAECKFLEEIIRNYSPKPKTILDAGCGTGGHAIQLAKMGYQVTGVDASEPMVIRARANAIRSGVSSVFHVGDLRSFDLGKPFDACISMFSVINYFTTYAELTKAFSNIRRHLSPQSLFVFDFWYGPAVLIIRPAPKMKSVSRDGMQVIRLAEPRLNTLRHVCEVDYKLLIIKNNSVITSEKETHIVRFYFPQEIEYFLETSGYELVRLCSFLDMNTPLSEETWDATAIARAV